eukprot:Gb_08423 [translate_table: standard]
MLRLNIPIIRGSCQPLLLAKRDCHTPLQRAPCSETYGTFGCSGIQPAVVLLEVAFDALDWSTYHTLRRLTSSVGSPALTNVASRMVCHFTLAIVFHPISLCPFVASICNETVFIHTASSFPSSRFLFVHGLQRRLIWMVVRMPGGGLFGNMPGCALRSKLAPAHSNLLIGPPPMLPLCLLLTLYPSANPSLFCPSPFLRRVAMAACLDWSTCDTSALSSVPSPLLSDSGGGGSFGRECMAGGGLFENMPCRALSSKIVASRSSVHLVALVAHPHFSPATSPRCPIVAVARLDGSACRAVGIIENMLGHALSSKLVAVRSLVVVSFGTDFRLDSTHLVSLVAHPHFSPAPSPCCPIVAVACLDGSACRAVGFFHCAFVGMFVLWHVLCDGKMTSMGDDPSCGAKRTVTGEIGAVESGEVVNRKDMGDVLVAISHEYVPRGNLRTLDKFCESPLPCRRESLRGMGTLTKPKGGGRHGALYKARQLGLPKGCGILVGVTNALRQPLLVYWAGPELSMDVERTSLGRVVPKGPTKGRIAVDGETLPVALRQEGGSSPSVPIPNGGNPQQGIIREDSTRGGGSPLTCWHVDRKGKRPIEEASQVESQWRGYLEHPRAVINGASLGTYPGESSAQAQMRGRGERVVTDEGTEGSQWKDLGRVHRRVYHTIHLPPPIEKAVVCGEGIRHDTLAQERTKSGKVGDGPQAENAASAPPRGSTTAGGTHLTSSNTPTFSVKGKSTISQRWDNSCSHKGFYTTRGLRGESSNSAAPSSLWPRRPHFNELRPGHKQDSQGDLPSEQLELVCIWNLGHLSRQAFRVELEVCLGVFWRDVVKWARVRDSWREGSVRFDVVVRAGKARVVLDRLRKGKGWVARMHSPGTGCPCDCVHLVALLTHPRFPPLPPLCCRILAVVARLDGSAWRAVGNSRICPVVRSLPSFTSALSSVPSPLLSDSGGGGSFGRECMAGGGLFENMPCRALSSKIVASRSSVHLVALVAHPHFSPATSPRCPIVAVARLDGSACRAVGIIENMLGHALSSKLVAVRSLVVVSFGTDFRLDSTHLVSLVAHPHFSPAPSPCCPIVAVACLDGSACRAVGFFHCAFVGMFVLWHVLCDGKMTSMGDDPSCGAKRTVTGEIGAVESGEVVNRKDMGDVLVAISHEYVPRGNLRTLDKFCESPLPCRRESLRGMGTLTKPKGGGRHGALYKARQLGLPKGCGILVGVTNALRQPLLVYWAGPELSMDVERTSLGRVVPKGPTKGRIAVDGETLPVALRQEGGSSPSVPIPNGGNPQQGIIREDSTRGGGSPLTCWHVDRKGKRPIEEASQVESQWRGYLEHPRAVINGASLGTYPGESSAQAQMRGRGERVVTDEGTEGSQWKDLGRVHRRVYHTIHLPPPIEKAVVCGEGIRHDTLAQERTKSGKVGDGPQAENAASAPPRGSTTAGGTHLTSSNTPTFSVKGKSTISQRWDNSCSHKGFYTTRGLRGESSNSAAPSSLWPRRPHFNELRPGHKQDSQGDLPSEQLELVCIWNLGHLSRQAFRVELEVCLGVFWRDVVKWARVRDSWREGSVRFDVVVRAGKARVVLDRLRKGKGWVARMHRSFKEREARRESVGRQLVSSEGWGIVGLQETRVWENSWPISISGMVVFQARGCLREVGQRGVAVAVSKEFRSFQVGPIDPNNIWAQVSHQSLGSRAWIFGSVYIPQRLHREERQGCLRRVLGAVQDLRSKFRNAPLVILGYWNMSLKSVEQWVGRCRGLQVLRVAGDRRSFHSAKGKSVSAIDHIVVNQHAMDLLGSGRVLRRIDGSNHWPVQTFFKQGSFLHVERGGEEGVKPLVFQRAKVNEVRDEIRLSNRWEPLEKLDCSRKERVEAGVRSFVDISVSVARSVGVVGEAGSRRPRSGCRVTGRIKRLIQERRRCFKEVLKARRGSSQERGAVERWKESKAATKKECARESWKVFQASLEKGRNLMVLNKQKEFWNWLKSLSESWQRHYARVLAEVEGRSQNPEAWAGVAVVEHPELTKINGPILWKEVKGVVKEIEYHKAAGVDGLSPEWFKVMLGSQKGGKSRRQRRKRRKAKKRLSPMVKAFLNVINGIWDVGHIPSDLNSAVLVSIPKKGDLTLHDNYRGISLISVLLKILTSVIIKRIDAELEERKFYSKSQAGFRKGEECVAQVVALKEIILRRNIKWKRATFMAFIDFKKAYDMVPHEAPMKKLRAVGVAGKALDFFKNLYKSTSVKVRFEDLVSPPIPVQRGVRQGCPTSPSLFNIFINDIMDGLQGVGVEVPGIAEVIAGLLFAEDLVLFAESVTQLKEMLEKVHDWAQKWGMACGIDNRKAMVVFGDQDSLKLEEILIGRDRIGVCDSYKYLGLEVDFKLSVERMIKERAVAGRKALFGMRHFLVDRRIPTWAKVLAFKALVHPCLTFGAEIIGMHNQIGATVLHQELNVCPIASFNAGQRARGFFKYRGLKTWVVDLVNSPCAYRVGEKWSWVHRTKKWIFKHAPQCQSQGLLVREAAWEAWESKHSTEALRFYKEFKLEGSRDFFKRAMRFGSVSPEKVRLLILARVGGCLLVRRAVLLGIADHRIGVRCSLCNEEGGDSLYHVLVNCPSLVHSRSRIEGLESLVSKLRSSVAALDDKSRLTLLLGGETGGRLCNWLRGPPHWRGTASFVHVANLLAEVIPLYNQALRDWEVQGDGPQHGPAGGPSGSVTTFEPTPERRLAWVGILDPVKNSPGHRDRECEFLAGAYPPSHARTWEPHKLGACV